MVNSDILFSSFFILYAYYTAFFPKSQALFCLISSWGELAGFLISQTLEKVLLLLGNHYSAHFDNFLQIGVYFFIHLGALFFYFMCLLYGLFPEMSSAF